MKTLKIFSLVLALAMATTAVHAERVAYRVGEADSFYYVVELSDTKNEFCGTEKARVFMSVAMKGSLFAKPFAAGCWWVDIGSEEVIVDLWAIDNGKYMQLRNYFTEYSLSQ